MKKLLLSVLMLALAVPAFAFDIPMADGMKLNMYGQVRMTAAYEGTNSSNGQFNATTSDFKMNWQGNSRFGINFSAGNFFANAEMKVTPDAVGSAGFRQFWGGYKMDNGLTIIAGQKTTLTGNGVSSDVYFTDNGLVGFGSVSDARRPMIMASYAGFDVALVTNVIDHSLVDGAEKVGEDYIPRLEVAYNLEMENLTAKIFGSYGLYTEKYTRGGATQPTSYANINAFHVGFDVMPTFGNMYVGLGAFFAMNAGMYGAVAAIDSTGKDLMDLKPSIVLDANGEAEIQDVTTFGGTLVFGMNLTDAIAFEVGGGYQLSTSDAYVDAAGDEADVAGYGVYVNAPITLFEGHFVVTPQVGYYGRSTDANLDGATSVEALIAGAQVVVKF